MRISDWSSDVCSSDLRRNPAGDGGLMANVFLLDPTLSDAATATGIGTLAASMPAEDVLNLAPGSRARWTSTTGPAIKLDLGASASWDAIIIAGHKDRKSTRLNSSH